MTVRAAWPALALAAAVAVAGAEPPTAPSAIAERTLTVGERTTRVSLFDNRVAVVSSREEGRVTVRRLTLREHEFEAVLRVIEIAADERPAVTVHDAHSDPTPGEILLHHGRPGPPERLPYSPLVMPELRTRQLIAALDDVETLVLEAPPWADEIRAWAPAVGDRVRLWDGVDGTVVELLPDGYVMVQRDVTWIRDVVPPNDREQLVVAVLDKAAP